MTTSSSKPKTETKQQCPYCAEKINIEAIKCPYCGSVLDRKIYLKTWQRLPKEGKILGICAGLARQFDMDATFIRIAFVIATFIGGLGFFLYMILWLLMPPAPEFSELPPNTNSISAPKE